MGECHDINIGIRFAAEAVGRVAEQFAFGEKSCMYFQTNNSFIFICSAQFLRILSGLRRGFLNNR